ncbi:MAG TPA: HK97 family phage prohead protease [Pirellulales bacterium]|jgi:hypothetical protein
MNLRTRFTPLARAKVTVARAAEGDKQKIRGYGSVFYDGTPETEYQLWDNYCERIMPGCFDRALREDDCRGLFNHDPSLILGRTAAGTMRLSVDARGLAYEIDPAETTIAQDCLQHLARQDVTGSSFSFTVDDEDLRRETRDGQDMWICEVRSVHLYDVGPVTFPAYTATTAEARSDVDGRVQRFLALQKPGTPVDAAIAAARARAIELG